MSAESSFDDLMNRLRCGDNEAAARVFHSYVQRLIALARSRLNGQIRRKEDPEDVVQSVFRSFFHGHTQGEFDIENWDSLWAMLALITLRKCGNRIEYYHAVRRDVTAEFHDSDESRTSWKAITREPTASQALVLAEIVENLMRGLDEVERTILSLRLQEFTIPEISERAGRAERTVRRVLNRIKRRLERMQQEA